MEDSIITSPVSDFYPSDLPSRSVHEFPFTRHLHSSRQTLRSWSPRLSSGPPRCRWRRRLQQEGRYGRQKVEVGADLRGRRCGVRRPSTRGKKDGSWKYKKLSFPSPFSSVPGILSGPLEPSETETRVIKNQPEPN